LEYLEDTSRCKPLVLPATCNSSNKHVLIQNGGSLSSGSYPVVKICPPPGIKYSWKWLQPSDPTHWRRCNSPWKLL